MNKMTIHSNTLRTGGQIIVDYLISEKIPYVFGIPGHGCLGLTDAFYT